VLSESAYKRSKRSRKRRASPDISLVARDREFAIILDHIARRKSLHIYGEGGTGKSALLEEVYDFLKARGTLIPIYCRSSRTLRNILLQMALFLIGHFSHLESVDKFRRIKDIKYAADLKKLGIRTLRDVVFTYISQADFCVILDHLEYVTPRINAFLAVLYERVPVVTASRQSWEQNDYSFKGILDYSLYLIPKLRIENLKRKEALALIENLSRSLHIAFPLKRKLFDEVLRISKGNPEVISTIFEKARRPEYLKDNKLNLGLILIDSGIEEIPRW